MDFTRHKRTREKEKVMECHGKSYVVKCVMSNMLVISTLVAKAENFRQLEHAFSLQIKKNFSI